MEGERGRDFLDRTDEEREREFLLLPHGLSAVEARLTDDDEVVLSAGLEGRSGECRSTTLSTASHSGILFRPLLEWAMKKSCFGCLCLLAVFLASTAQHSAGSPTVERGLARDAVYPFSLLAL
jgi:hypothetical protein